MLDNEFPKFDAKTLLFSRKIQKRPKNNFCVNFRQAIRKNKYAQHIRLCEDKQHLRIVMPREELKLKFVNWETTQKGLSVVCADSEALDVALNVSRMKITVINDLQVWASIGGHISGNSKQFCFCRVLLARKA